METYEETLYWIHELLAFGMKPGLLRMEWMLEQLGNPEEQLRAVHIAGTNGKGSTLTYMRCVLQEAGYEVGTFTSPYIERFNERISINGIPITDEELVDVANEVKPVAEQLAATDLGTPTEFEVVTVLSIVFFAKYKHPDVIIFETGLGGRLDSTNVIKPLLTGITNIGYDHTSILGSTIKEIAFEKSGILKTNIPLVTAVEQVEAIDVVETEAINKNVRVQRFGKDYQIVDQSILVNGERFSLRTNQKTYLDLEIHMSGEHQIKNASMAIVMLEELAIQADLTIKMNDIQKGLKKTNWPGRFEKVQDNPTVIIDGAHNKEGIQSLKQTLESHYPHHQIRLIFSALSDKPVEGMLSELYDTVHHIMFTSFDFPRASSAQSLFEKCRFGNKDLAEDFRDAIQIELERIEQNQVLIITGSLYFISDVREFLKNKK